MQCQHSDRDNPNLICGYPLPCPHHTVVIDMEERTVTVPADSPVEELGTFREIIHALEGEN